MAGSTVKTCEMINCKVMQWNSTGAYALETTLKSVTYRIEGFNDYFIIRRQHFKSVNLTRKAWYAANISFRMCQVDNVFVIIYEYSSYLTRNVQKVSRFLHCLKERCFTEFARTLKENSVSTYENSERLLYILVFIITSPRM